jgi:hypothetical protein
MVNIKSSRLPVFCILFSLIYISALNLSGLSCPFSAIFNFPTPTCGLTRAWISFFQGDFSKAFYYHPLFPLAPFLFFLIFKYKQNRVYKILALSIAAAFFITYLMRLFFADVAQIQ